MKKIKITLEIETKYGNGRSVSKLEKLVNAFIRLWKVTLASNLCPKAKTELLRLIVVFSTLLALTYLLFCILTLILNRL